MAKDLRNFEMGWDIVHKAIMKKKNILARVEKEDFTATESAHLKSILNGLVKYDRLKILGKLFKSYKEYLEEYISRVILPALRAKKGKLMLRELVNGWNNYMHLVNWIKEIFLVLDQGHHSHNGRQLSTLSKANRSCFRDMVYYEVKHDLRAGIVKLIYQDREASREGKHTDRAVFQNLLKLQRHMEKRNV